MAFATPFQFTERSAAAAANEDQRDDEDPDPVVVEYVAQTVIHGIPPKYEMGRGLSCPCPISLYVEGAGMCGEKEDFCLRQINKGS